MRYLSIILVLLFQSLTGQSIDYKEVSVDVSERSIVERLLRTGIDLDHTKFDKQGILKFIVSTEDEQRLQQAAIPYTVLVEDMRAQYQQMLDADVQNNTGMERSLNVADGFDLGSMGGFYTFSEVENKLDEMFTEYPDIVSQKVSIGTSIEGRRIWMVKISDNPNIDEAEPVAYFDALHHAREPLAMATTINYMFWLLENYGVDPAVTYLIDNRELYFVPVVNPDGYVFNQTTDPDGGGLWRKNMRPDPGGCIGVDLNRNYGFGYANNNDCSSTDPCSNIYRGSAAFSEPESIAVSNFIALIRPSTAFSTHSTAGSYLMPYGFDTSPPEFGIYSEWASAFLSENDYPYGVTFQMLGYTSCGTTRDYFHSEGIYTWTPEIDGAGFWPPPSTIFDLVGENVYPMLYQSWIAGGYVELQSYEQSGQAIPGNDFELVIEVKNTGIGGNAKNVSVEITTNEQGVTISPAVEFGSIPLRQRTDNNAQPFLITIDPGFDASSFDLVVQTFQDNAANGLFSIPIEVGESEIIFQDDADSGADNWTASGDGMEWGVVSDDSFSGSNCFGDSNGSNSLNNTQNYFELNEVFDLTQTTSPLLQFNTKYSIESDDAARLEISLDNGTSWQSIESYSSSSDWRTEVVYLQQYIEQDNVRFRFSMTTDNFLPADGFYFDDFKLIDFERELLGASDVGINANLVITPNPFDSRIYVQIPESLRDVVHSIEVMDSSGRIVKYHRLKNQNSVTIDLGGTMNSGLYFLRLSDSSDRPLEVRKLIKK